MFHAFGSEVTVIAKRPGGGFSVQVRAGGTEDTVDADLVLMAVGRRPVIPEGATELGLPMEGHGLAVEPSIQIPGHPHLYAPGDVNGRSMLFHSAVRQSLVAAHNILAGNQVVDRMDFDAVPATIFTAPEGAYVGLTRASAAKRHLDAQRARTCSRMTRGRRSSVRPTARSGCSSPPRASASAEGGSSGSTPPSSSAR